MRNKHAVGPLRVIWGLGLLVVAGFLLHQTVRIYDSGDAVKALGWFGTTFGGVAVLGLVGREREGTHGVERFVIAVLMSLVHIIATLLVLSRIAIEFSLEPLDRFQPYFGFLTPFVVGALGWFYFDDRGAPDGAPPP